MVQRVRKATRLRLPRHLKAVNHPKRSDEEDVVGRKNVDVTSDVTDAEEVHRLVAALLAIAADPSRLLTMKEIERESATTAMKNPTRNQQ